MAWEPAVLRPIGEAAVPNRRLSTSFANNLNHRNNGRDCLRIECAARHNDVVVLAHSLVFCRLIDWIVPTITVLCCCSTAISDGIQC